MYNIDVEGGEWSPQRSSFEDRGVSKEQFHARSRLDVILEHSSLAWSLTLQKMSSDVEVHERKYYTEQKCSMKKRKQI